MKKEFQFHENILFVFTFQEVTTTFLKWVMHESSCPVSNMIKINSGVLRAHQ